METKTYLLGVVAALSLSAQVASAESPYDGEYSRPCWNLTPDARAFVSECAAQARSYRPRSERTMLFCRSQLKYGNERTDYLHNWYERPLYQDSTFGKLCPGNQLINELSWRRQVAGMRLTKLDGFASYLSTARRIELLDRSTLPGAEALVLAEFCGRDVTNGREGRLKLAERLLGQKNVFRIDGKVVIAGMPGIDSDAASGPANYWRQVRAELDEKFGPGKFLLMPYGRVVIGHDLNLRSLDRAALVRMRDGIREVLRQVDGLFYHMAGVFWGRRYNPEFHDNVVLPVLHSVLAEPEFSDKRLAVALTQGHENCYRWSYIADSTGTRMLRDSLASVEKARPDFIMFTEWDEENENTHMRPLTSNGHVTQRVTRYWADRFAHRAPDVFPGDDTSVPNLVVSYRKSLLAGEPAEVEVLNVPDGTAPAEKWNVSFRWKTADGRVAKEWAAKTIDAREMSAAWFKCPASELVESRILFPELVVTAAGRTETFGRGMWPLNVEANRNLDFKWVKNALREIPKGVEGGLTVGPRLADGSFEVKGFVKGRARFRHVEVLENFDTAYMYDASAPEGLPGQVTLRISCEGVNGSNVGGLLNGSISLSGPEGVRFRAAKGRPRCTIDERKVTFRKAGLDNWRHSYIVDLPEGAVAESAVEVAIPGVLEKRVSVGEIVAKGSVSYAAPYARMFVFERIRSPFRIPPPCNVSEASFSFGFKPSSPLSVLRLRAIDENYRIWHASAVPQFLTPTGRKVRFHVCERTSDATVRELSLDSSRLVSLDYSFAGSRGDAMYSGPFDDMPMVLGNGVSLVTGVGRGESGYGNALHSSLGPLSKDPDFAHTTPRLSESGSLVFDKCAYASLPLQTLPIFAGFEMEIRVKPEWQEEKVALFDNGNLGVSLTLCKGVSEAFVCNGNDLLANGANRAEGYTVRGPALKIGEWNVVKLVLDHSQTFIEVDGVRGEAKSVSGWRFNPRVGCIGARVEVGVPKSSKEFFHGEIGSFKVVPR